MNVKVRTLPLIQIIINLILSLFAVQLFDSDYTLIQSALVNFKTNATCLCYGNCGCEVS